MERNNEGPLFDPTKNVLDLVRAESKYQNDIRAMEIKRLDDIAAERRHYETLLEAARTKALDSTTALLAAQLKEFKDMFSDRMARLEQFRWESGGKTAGLVAAVSFGGFLISAAVAVAAIFFKN